MIEGPKLPRIPDEPLGIAEYDCICSMCQHFWIETLGTSQASCPRCGSTVFSRTEHRRPLKQY